MLIVLGWRENRAPQPNSAWRWGAANHFAPLYSRPLEVRDRPEPCFHLVSFRFRAPATFTDHVNQSFPFIRSEGVCIWIS